VNNNKFKLTLEAVSHLIEVLRLHSPLKQVMKELVNDGVEDVERQIFESRFNTLLDILKEYSDVKVIKRERIELPKEAVFPTIAAGVAIAQARKVIETVIVYDSNEVVIDREEIPITLQEQSKEVKYE
jgi:hypothetical protein